MDANILGAIILGVATIVAALLAGRERAKRKSSDRHVDDLEQAIIKTAQQPTGAVLGGAAYTLEKFRRVTAIDTDGGGVQRKEWIGLKATQHLTNYKIPFRSRFEGPPGTQLSGPSVETFPGSSREVHLVKSGAAQLATGDTILEGQIQITGDLGPDVAPVNFALTVPFRNGFCTTREDVLEVFKSRDWNQEYSAVRVPAPTDVLEAIVRMPPSHRKLDPPPMALAFVGETETVHRKETERIRSQLQFSDGIATLIVPDPVIGISYAISWMPPSIAAAKEMA